MIPRSSQRNAAAEAVGSPYGRRVTVPLLERAPTVSAGARRVARRRRFLMCPPRYFDVVYSINPWMDPSIPVDCSRAMAQWEDLVATYRCLGHDIEVVPPVAGVPDMVFSANSAVVADDRVLLGRFRHRERTPEEVPYRDWFAQRSFVEVRSARSISEGEGDFAFAGRLVLAGWGFRTSRAAHDELQEYFGVPVVSLRLVDPRFYHLDIALCVLDARTIAYFPPAFSPGSRRALERLFPDAMRIPDRDACALGLNAVSDGYHVVLPDSARTTAEMLRVRGFEPVPVDVSEFRKAGGGVKCCTLELRGHEDS
jgi:N-dimethylarginine dimethylaminohydrolase